jgi:hypothetical protein
MGGIMKQRMFYEADGTSGGTPAAEEPVKTEPAEPVKTEPKPEKYTDEWVNNLVAGKSKEAAEKARREIYKELGVKDADELKKLREMKEAQMTAEERMKAELEESNKASDEIKKEAEGIRAENEALKKGVPADKVERVKKLVLSGVYEGETVAEKVAAVLAEFPEYAKAVPGDIGAKTGNQTVSEETRLLELARKQAGLTK